MHTRSSPLGRLRAAAASVVARGARVIDRRGATALGAVVPDVAVDPGRITCFRRESFPAAGPLPWLDRPDALERIDDALAAGRVSIAAARLCRQWVRDGFIVLPGFFTQSRIDALWSAYESAIAAGTFAPLPERMSADDPFPGRILNPHMQSPAFNDILCDRDMLAIVGMLLGARALPFQTIIGHKGSEQLPHSDSVHMTTYPLGYLAANWIALEDIHADSGPLVYYPGSHRLPYLMSADVGIAPTAAGDRIDYVPYHDKYEPAIARAVAEHGLEPAYFTPNAGDVFVWHANLVHGGSPRRAAARSRKALVCHYFAEGCVTYHDLTGTPTRLQTARMRSGRTSGSSALHGLWNAARSALSLAPSGGSSGPREH